MSEATNIRAMKKATRKSMPKVRTGCQTCKYALTGPRLLPTREASTMSRL